MSSKYQMGLPCVLFDFLVAQTVKRLPTMQETLYHLSHQGSRRGHRVGPFDTQVRIPGLGRSPGEGNGNLLQYSCLENPMDGKTWQATVHGVTKSQTQLSNFTFRFDKV